MADTSKPVGSMRFGPYELSLEHEELRKAGNRLKLTGQAIQVLLVLANNPGKLVTREELQQRLWPGVTCGDFEHGLNAAVNRLRETLGDSATEPKFIETIPRRGYRFIGPICEVSVDPRHVEHDLQSRGSSAIAVEVETQATPLESHPEQRRCLWAISSILLAGVATFLYLWTRPLPAPRVVRTTQMTDDGKSKSMSLGNAFTGATLATDGSRVYFTNEVETG